MSKNSSRKNKVYDCFTFYNELELLEVRLNILDEVVDKFVLIESKVTYTNQKKPLYYLQNKQKYKKFKDKIIHVIVDDTPDVSNPWFVEHYLMAAAKKGLKNAQPNDTILISNLDEIPNPEKIIECKDRPERLMAFKQKLFYYFLNYGSSNHQWIGTKMTSYKNFNTFYDAYIIRHSPNDFIIENGGWHFSYMGGLKRIKEKIATGTHQEFNNNSYNTKERILRSMIENRDIFGHGDKFELVSVNDLPVYIQKNKKKYNKMILQKKQMASLSKVIVFFLEIKHTLRIIYRNLRGNINQATSQRLVQGNVIPTMGVVDS